MCVFLLTNQKLVFPHTANQVLFLQSHFKKRNWGCADKDFFVIVWLLDLDHIKNFAIWSFCFKARFSQCIDLEYHSTIQVYLKIQRINKIVATFPNFSGNARNRAGFNLKTLILQHSGSPISLNIFKSSSYLCSFFNPFFLNTSQCFGIAFYRNGTNKDWLN